jgi:hypothetical protein
VVSSISIIFTRERKEIKLRVHLYHGTLFIYYCHLGVTGKGQYTLLIRWSSLNANPLKSLLPLLSSSQSVWLLYRRNTLSPSHSPSLSLSLWSAQPILDVCYNVNDSCVCVCVCVSVRVIREYVTWKERRRRRERKKFNSVIKTSVISSMKYF